MWSLVTHIVVEVMGVDHKAMNTNSNLELALSEYLYQTSRLY